MFHAYQYYLNQKERESINAGGRGSYFDPIPHGVGSNTAYNSRKYRLSTSNAYQSS